MPDILIIDDDTSLARMLTLQFEETGLKCESVHTVQDGLNYDKTPRLILLDHHLPDMLGLEAIPHLKEKFSCPIIMMTGKHDMTLAIQAIKAGAVDYIHKPINEDIIQAAVTKHLPKSEAKKGKATAVEEKEVDDTPHIIGTSHAILEVIKTIAIASQNDATVLIQGESGTGKEVVARAIHYHSQKSGRFVGVNCSALVDNLLESEVFGHEKGAFTGAVERKEGKFIQAENGTLFLDEIAEMSPHLQSKLLRVLQENQLERVGGHETLTTNARIIAATHQNMDKMIVDGTFREDLYYRLKVITINLPPLRERLEDLQLLVPFLMNKAGKKIGKKITSIDENVWPVLYAHNWPGNIRELENALMRAMATCQGHTLTADLFSLTTQGQTTTTEATTSNASLPTLEEVEKQHIALVLKATKGHKGKTATILDISRPALNRKIEKYGL